MQFLSGRCQVYWTKTKVGQKRMIFQNAVSNFFMQNDWRGRVLLYLITETCLSVTLMMMHVL